MTAILQALLSYLTNLVSDFTTGWNRFWFTPRAPTTLAVIRIGAGLVLLYVHLTTLPWLMDIVGPQAWIDQQAITDLQQLAEKEQARLLSELERRASRLTPEQVELEEQDIAHQAEWLRWYALSLWQWVQEPTLIWIGHSLFLAALVAFTLGLFTRLANVLVWFGHLSYIQRGYLIWYGMDVMLLMVTFYLMFAPTGRALALDCWRRRQPGQPVDWFGQPHWTVTVVTRLLQIHMCIVYLCAGISKLQGPTWWHGTAAWITMNTMEFALFDVSNLGLAPDVVWQSISLAFTYATLIFEIAFCFCVWSPRLRPIMLFSAFLLHAGIGLFMGLISFGVIMLTACMAFISPEGMQWFLQQLGIGRSLAAAGVPAGAVSQAAAESASAQMR